MRILPIAIIEPAVALAEFLAETMTFSGATKRGLITMVGFDVFLTIVRKYASPEERSLVDTYSRLTKDAQVSQPFAEKEVVAGFPRTSVHNAIETWAAIESTVEEVLIILLENTDNAADLITASINDPQRLKNIASWDAGRVRKAWEPLIEKVDVADRYIEMLSVFGVQIYLQTTQRQKLSELGELRNILLHKKGRVDQRFLSKCPWRTELPGDEIKIDHSAMLEYFDAAKDFALQLSSGILNLLRNQTRGESPIR